jgi:ABC-type phosphate transport system substrate-binding protein
VKSLITGLRKSSSKPRPRRIRWLAPLFGVTSLLLVLTGTAVGADTAAGTAPSDSAGTSTTTTTTTTTTTWPVSSATPPPIRERPFVTGIGIAGTGSSFASPAVTNWTNEVGQSPYNLSVNYTPSNSGQGRYEFTNGTVDYAVSDTGYVSSSVGTTPPSFAYEFIPITAAGVAFMYNIPGLTQPLQLTSYTACLLLTGQITNWNDPALKQNGANASVTLPNLPVKPVTESDPAGTNFVLEEYCIAEQPSVWAQYAKNEGALGLPPSGVPISATTPGSNWEAPQNGIDTASTSAVASNIANTAGSIGPVQENYATDSGFTGSDPSRGVAQVQNASGKFTTPTPVDVASALAYATQQPNGTHQLNFNGLGPNVYNPSTYSYLLTPTTGWSPSKGDTMSQFVNYVLTLGQQAAPKFGYASLGLSLERYGIDEVIAHVPGAVDPTTAESQAYACGDLTPTEVQAGQTTPTCGVTNGNPPPPPPGATNIATTNGNPGATGSTAAVKAPAAGAAGSGSSRSSSSGSGAGADPSVSLVQTSAMAGTGIDPLPLIFIGVMLLIAGVVGRRRLQAHRRREEPS